jgi:eukaryotic-like serine/threonine-protein kinase
MTEHDLYLTARDKTDPTERATYLDRACAGDSGLRKRIESLLTEPLQREPDSATSVIGTQAHEAEPDPTSALPLPFEATRTLPASASTSGPAVATDKRIGRYRLLEQLGEGGMGVVYLAEQERPVRRRVALKIIKPGPSSAVLVARFEAERQALALMDHANISRVLDAGATPGGRPYFVMEFVKGVPITQHCDQNRLTISERLELFVPVCRAIQHAHQKGIIHRDIKPSNVLVAIRDGKPVPTVIDFGIAKATDQKLTDETVHTQHGTVVGTLEYMSPEQAEASPAGVDTRSDVYSLGALLYELLAGTTPFGRNLLREVKYADMLRIIREVEPSRPSQRVEGSADASELAGLRKTDPQRLARQLRGEIDWIVMKALEKDRTRRYETADALGRDVERFLKDEPVEASPPSASYRMRKFVRRHRGWIAIAAAFAFVLATGAAVSTWLAIRATHLLEDATRAEATAREEKQRADEQTANAVAVSDFLRNDLLARSSADNQARPGVRPDRNVTVRTLLDRAADRIGGKFSGKPRVEAAVRQTMGNTYLQLGLYPEAEKHLQRALDLNARELGEDHAETLASMNNLAGLYEARGVYDKAEPLLARVFEIQRRNLGDEHPDTLTSMNNLGLLYQSRGRLDAAEGLLARTLQVRLRDLGEPNANTLASMNNLALLYEAEGRHDKAEPLLKTALAGRRQILGDDHPNTLASMYNLGSLCRTLGRTKPAEQLLTAALDGRRRVLGEEHPDTVSSMNGLGLLFASSGQFARAEELFNKTLDIRARSLGEEHPQTLASVTNLGLAYESRGEFAKAEPLLVKALEGRGKALGAEHPDTLVAMNNLGLLYLNCRQFARARDLFDKALQVQRRVLGDSHPAVEQTEGNLARAYDSLGEFAKSEPLLEHALETRRRGRGADSPEVAAALAALGTNRLRQHKYAAAEQSLRDSLALYAQHQPETWQRSYVQALLGDSLFGQKNYVAAESQLLAGYEGLKPHADRIPSEVKERLPALAEHLHQLYATLGQHDKAERWRKEAAGTE